MIEVEVYNITIHCVWGIFSMKNLNKNNRLHLEIQKHRTNPYGLIRSTYRENGKIKHQTHSRITGLDIDTLRLIQAALQGDVVLRSDF